MINFKGKKILITGGTGGIGKELVKKFVSLNGEVLATGTKKYNGISKLGSKGIPRRIDIMYTKPEEYPFAILYFTGSGDFFQNSSSSTRKTRGQFVAMLAQAVCRCLNHA